MTTLKPNPGKKLGVIIDGKKYARYPIKTKKITEKDKIEEIVENFVKKHLKKNDIVVISERVVAITQGRMVPIEKIKPGFWAKALYKFVTKNPAGIGLAHPQTMELAIRETGLLRILIAGLISALTKPFGIKGIFYNVAGSDINAIDGPTSYSLPPGDKSATLGPKNPQKIARQLSQIFNTSIAIIDANDYGVRVMACSNKDKSKLVEKIFKDNPLGQGREQTPIAIVRVFF